MYHMERAEDLTMAKPIELKSKLKQKICEDCGEPEDYHIRPKE